MQKATLNSLLISSMVLLGGVKTAQAEDLPESKIQAFLSNGRLVFTNAAPNAPAPAEQETAPSPVLDMLHSAMPAPIRDLVHSISNTHGVDPLLVAAVMKVESNYNPRARSPKGAMGLMQLIPATGKRFGVQNFYDPEENIEGGVRYLRFLTDKFGESNLDLVLAGYNAGENVVERLNAVPNYRETRDYVSKVRRIYQLGNNARLVSASNTRENVAATSAEITADESAPAPINVIYRRVDERGVIHFSNAPPN
jgi:soluble lytic murein transglycosylase-like protein